jgi:outer membrane protein assembly factor BamD (BamD/ComL family)
VSPASRAFADAMAALRHGDYAGGAAQLDAFSTAHAGDPRADEADYLRAVALQRAGRATEAAAAARQYLARRPVGAHRAEAKEIADE